MAKSTDRRSRRRATVPSSQVVPAAPAARDSRPLLERMLDTPAIAQLVPRLQPEVLHRVIQNCGLEDCSELVALATPNQLARVFDLDLWSASQPGQEERFDADRFGVWLGVLLECGADVAARKLAGMDTDLVIAGISRYVRVFDPAALSPSVSPDGDEWEAPEAHDGVEIEVGGYRLVARRADSWDAIVATLIALDAEHQLFFHRVMRECRRLSNSGYELDGLDDLLGDDAQVMFDVALGRERRRDAQGYVAPAEARAFLQMSRRLDLLGAQAPAINPLARSYFHTVASPPVADPQPRSARLRAAPESDAESAPDPAHSPDAVAAIVGMLQEAGVLPEPPRSLLGDAPVGATRLGRMQKHMQIAGERDPLAWVTRHQEMAYLANAIMTGCSIQARSFTAQEASDAVVAACNLGLERWPLHWREAPAAGLPDGFLVDHDLVTVFQVGWAVLHDTVCIFTAQRLISVLGQLRCEDREIKIELDALRRQLKKHLETGMPWLARDAFDVIAILDMPAWAALLGLVDECPVMHAAIAASRNVATRAVSPSAFEFISENSQIAAVQEFVQSLPDRLRS
ncbi:MAG TPA: DUF6178 family protein [Vicinamibacterales bacterium]